MYDVIIVGAGIAGMTAAIYLRRAGKTVLILESGVRGGQIINTVGIENYPGFLEISGAELTDKIYHQANNLGAEFEYAKVLKIDLVDPAGSSSVASFGGVAESLPSSSSTEPAKGFVVKTDDGDYSARAIIIATGTEPRKLDEFQMKSAGSRPISYCATCDGALYKGKKVVVVGSGNTAKHEIKYLEGICDEVFHIHHTDPIPEEAEAVFVAIGRVPGTEFLKGVVKLDEDGYIVADEDCQTSVSGIFVAGDCRTKVVRQLVTAAGDGAAAAEEATSFLSEEKTS